MTETAVAPVTAGELAAFGLAMDEARAARAAALRRAETAEAELHALAGRIGDVIRAAAEAGNPQAQYELGTMLLSGTGVEKKPEEVIRLAVRRMLPKGALGNHLLTRLKIYAGSDHPHAAQCPEEMPLLEATLAELARNRKNFTPNAARSCKRLATRLGASGAAAIHDAERHWLRQ